MMEGFSQTPRKNRDGGNDSDSKDAGEGSSSSEADNSDKSSKEIVIGEINGSPDMRSDRGSSEKKMELSSPSATGTSTSSTGKTKSFPSILGGVRRESEIRREILDMIADMPQRPLEISVSMQTDASWLHDHIYKRKSPLSAPKEHQEEVPPENDIYAVVPQDLSYLEILCDTEFREDFLKLFQESLQTISSVGPPTIIAYRPESSRADIHIEVPKETLETCEFCGSPIKYFPSFESLEHIAEWGNRFCCQQCRELHEFIVNEKNRYPVKMEKINIAPHKAHGSQADRERAKERARQRLKERQIAKQVAYMAVEAEKSALPMHIPEYNKQLKTISFLMSQETLSSAIIHPPKIKKAEVVDNTYSISCCDLTIANGKLMKNQFIQQYYKNGVKFLTMFPDGTAQILYPFMTYSFCDILCSVERDQKQRAAAK